MTKVPSPIQSNHFHDAHLWLFLFCFFIAVALPFQWFTVVVWSFIVSVIAVFQRVERTFLFKSLAFALLLSVSIWVLNAVFHTPEVSQAQAYQNANQVGLKVWAMTWVALLSSKMLNVRDVISFALQRGWLSVQIAYALMVGMGSIGLLSDEVRRIMLNARLRGLSWRQKFLQWIPLLVFALRHSQRGAMSLRARCLNDSKTFYYDYQATKTQSLRMLGLWAVVVLATLYCELIL